MDKHIVSINLGESQTGLSLKVDIVKPDGTILYDCEDITTGIVEIGGGTYSFYYDQYPNNFVGIIKVKNSSGTVLTSCSIEPDISPNETVVPVETTPTLTGWYNIALQFIESYVDITQFTETQWMRKLNIAARECIKCDYDFASSYTIDCTGDVEDWTISSDPTGDDDFVEFVAWKTMCHIYTKFIQDRIANAALIKDGSSYIDTRSSLDNKFSDLTPCEIFDNMVEERYSTKIDDVLYNFGEEKDYYEY
jgi:hypothetical protein